MMNSGNQPPMYLYTEILGLCLPTFHYCWISCSRHRRYLKLFLYVNNWWIHIGLLSCLHILFQLVKLFAIAPFDQMLTLDGRKLEGDDMSLTELKLYPGCLLFLKVRQMCTTDVYYLCSVYILMYILLV